MPELLRYTTPGAYFRLRLIFDPKEVNFNVCSEPNTFSETILSTASGLLDNYNNLLVIDVVNMVGMVSFIV